MRVSDIDYARIGLWSHTDLAYIQQDPALRPYYAYPPTLGSFNEELANRQSFKTDRKLLARVLHRQYHALGYELPVLKSVIEDERTFTIATAHQPVLFTGPLFHIYKIAGTIHLARQLQHEHQGYQFLPVFVLGSEDHDWAEVNHFHLFGKTITWDRQASGANGRLDLSGLQVVTNEVSTLLGNSPHGAEISLMLEDALKRATTYAQFHQALLIRLFRDHGLVILDMDDPDLKRSFLPVLKKEIESQFSLPLVTATQSDLENAGFKAQAFCRPVNLFYLSEGMRERLEPTTDGFMGVDSKKQFSKIELLDEVEQHPERFSPNVILRPVYQEWVLPNLAYIGGGGELAYWLERKSQFEAAHTHFPMLVRRNSLLLIDAPTQQQIEKSG
ncbi:MAG TPA: bacillithiol biosynthesis cysteine-adding enzyme BshC, partial [Saprospiraceae bacterium]|nr:bacillithiol biosynthesis cysteine-adding enzyme BshC [Saprospiraceae bacterium]